MPGSFGTQGRRQWLGSQAQQDEGVDPRYAGNTHQARPRALPPAPLGPVSIRGAQRRSFQA